MEFSLFDSMRKKRLQRKYLLFLTAVIVFASLIYYPIYLHLNSDVLWSGSPVRLLWMEIVEPLVNYLIFWGAFAFFLYSCARYSVKGSAPILALYAAGTLLRYLLQNLVFVVMMGMNAWESEFYFSDLLISLLLDVLIMGAAAVPILLWKKNAVAGRLLASPETADLTAKYLPFSGFFDFQNLLLKTALIMSIFPSAVRLLLRVWYDINLIVFHGVPVADFGEVMLIVTYYLSDVASFLVGYLVIFMIVSSLHLSDEKARLSRDN